MKVNRESYGVANNEMTRNSRLEKMCLGVGGGTAAQDACLDNLAGIMPAGLFSSS